MSAGRGAWPPFLCREDEKLNTLIQVEPGQGLARRPLAALSGVVLRSCFWLVGWLVAAPLALLGYANSVLPLQCFQLSFLVFSSGSFNIQRKS